MMRRKELFSLKKGGYRTINIGQKVSRDISYMKGMKIKMLKFRDVV
jgi:hypothetical protein